MFFVNNNIIAYYNPSDKSIYTLTNFKSKKKFEIVSYYNRKCTYLI